MVTNPYSVLGISENATDDEVKSAYRELAKKYHPDKYVDSPLKDVASEKMKEINEAYDMIIDMRKNNSSESGGNQAYSRYGSSDDPIFQKVRSLIMSKNLDEADRILDSMSEGQKTAEWYFLKGMSAAGRGWSEQAFQYIQKAVQMNPGNPEYNAAYNNILHSRQYGPGTGYNQPTQVSNCSCCDICTGIMCADLCCNCCGGC